MRLVTEHTTEKNHTPIQFYNTTDTENSLVHEAWSLVDADITSYPLAQVTRRFNIALEKLVGIIINIDGVNEYHDPNITTLPVGPGTLVEGQESYTFADTYLKVKRLKVKDVNGNWQPLQQIDQSDFDYSGIAIEESFSTTGLPTHYDILENNIRLYPAPTATAVTLAAGLKIEFVQTADLFTVSDTTQQPGLPSPYHFLLPTWAALQYAKTYKKDRVASLLKDWLDGVEEMEVFYSKRNPDRRSIMTKKSEVYI